MLVSKEAENKIIERTGLIHRVYLPEKRSAKNPLFVLVHGRAGEAKVMWVFSKALENVKPVVVSPQATVVDEIGGFSWWSVSPEKNISEEEKIKEIFSASEKLEKFILECHKVYKTNPKETYIAGFSQGGAVASCLSLIKPNFFKGVALLSSFIPVTLTDNLERVAPQAMSVRNLTKYFLFHGKKDQVIEFSRAEKTMEFLKGIGVECELHSDEVAHKVSSSGINALRVWVEEVLSQRSVGDVW